MALRHPLEFTVYKGTDSTQVTTLLVTRPLDAFSVALLNPETLGSSAMVYFFETESQRLPPASAYLLQMLVLPMAARPALMVPTFLANVFKVFETVAPLPEVPKDQTLILPPLQDLTVEKMLETWAEATEATTESSQLPKTVFSMKPPQAANNPPPVHQHIVSPQHEQSPEDFLALRYFNTLYSLTTPLNYFPKTALSRLRNMCPDKNELAGCVASVLWSPEQLLRRHEAQYGLVPAKEPVTRFERDSQATFLSKYLPNTLSEDAREKLVLELKIREAQLQILVLLEMLCCREINEESFLNPKSEPVAKKLLVRRKAKKRTSPAASANSSPAPSQSADLYQTLTRLIDQLGLWDLLVLKPKLQQESPNNGFLAYVVVPYFAQRLPLVVPFVVKAFKALEPRIRSSRAKQAKKSDPAKPAKPKFAKALLLAVRVPKLDRSASAEAGLLSGKSGNHAELEPAFSLKRSKLNLGLKNLKKRQVDMSLVARETAEEMPRLSLFGDARRAKLEIIPPPSLSQVEATPSKPRRGVLDLLLADTKSQVLATPSRPKTRSSRFQKPGQKLMDKISAIDSSPVGPDNMDYPNEWISEVGPSPVAPSQHINDPTASLKPPTTASLQITSSSPIGASPTKTKPGQQISLLDSPFISTKLPILPFFTRSASTRSTAEPTSSPLEANKSVRPMDQLRPVSQPEAAMNIPEPMDQSSGINSQPPGLMEPPGALHQSPIAKVLPPGAMMPPLLKRPLQTKAPEPEDLDSDLERLIALDKKPPIRKYSTKRVGLRRV